MSPLKLSALILLLLLASHAVQAAPPAPRRVAAAMITLEQAVAQVRKETGGRILAAETVEENGRRVHRIKVLTPNHSVRTVRIDAGNGR